MNRLAFRLKTEESLFQLSLTLLVYWFGLFQSSLTLLVAKKLTNTDDIWGIRVQIGSNIFRFLGFFDKGNFIVLTNGFQKKTQKTPKSEMLLSEQRKQDYLARNRL